MLQPVVRRCTTGAQQQNKTNICSFVMVHALLQESKSNVLKDFVHVAGPLGVTQFLILTATENAGYLRIAKTPRVSS